MDNIRDLLGMRSPRHVAAFLATVVLLVVAFGFAITQIAPSYDSSPIGTTSQSVDIDGGLEPWQQSLGNDNGAAPLPDDPEKYTYGSTNEPPCDSSDPTQVCQDSDVNGDCYTTAENPNCKYLGTDPYTYLSDNTCKGACDPLTERPANEESVVEIYGRWDSVEVPVNDAASNSIRKPSREFWCSGPIAHTDAYILTAGHCAKDMIHGTEMLYGTANPFFKDGDVGKGGSVSTAPATGNSQTHGPMLSLWVKQRNSGPDAVIPNWTPAHYVDGLSSSDGDVALIKVDGVPAEAIKPLQVSLTPAGNKSTVRILGYPTETPSCLSFSTHGLPVGDCYDSRDSVTERVTTVNKRAMVSGVQMLQLEHSALPGMSGGPVLRSNGRTDEIVGILSGGLDGQDLQYAVDLPAIRALMIRNGLLMSDNERQFEYQIDQLERRASDLEEENHRHSARIGVLTQDNAELRDNLHDMAWVDDALGWLWFLFIVALAVATGFIAYLFSRIRGLNNRVSENYGAIARHDDTLFGIRNDANGDRTGGLVNDVALMGTRLELHDNDDERHVIDPEAENGPTVHDEPLATDDDPAHADGTRNT